MIYKNTKTIIQFFASIIWNLSEATGIGLGKYAPKIFGAMIGKKSKKLSE